MRLTRMRVGVGASGAAFHRAGVLALVAQVGCAANVTRAADAPDFAHGPAPAASPFPMSTPASDPSASAASFAAAAAQRLFARANSCPADRITTTPASADAATPPPDVAADPGRLAVWQQNRAADRRKRVDVSGCGHSMRFACNVSSARSDAFCLPDFSGVTNSVIINPAGE